MDADTIQGVTSAIIQWTTEEIKKLATRFVNRDLAFVGDSGTIAVVKEQRNSIEWELYSEFIKDKKLRTLIQMGLTLRSFENEHDKRENLRTKIIRAHQISGLHVAEFVQSDFLGKFFGSSLTKAKTKVELTGFIEEILNNIDKYVSFIKEGDSVSKKSEEIKVRIQANLPHSFIITGLKSGCSTAKSVKDALVKILEDQYSPELFEDANRFACFLNRKN